MAEAGGEDGLARVARSRLASQLITASRCSTPEEVVRTLGAIQAQDHASSLWAIGLRLPGATEARIEQAIEDRTIVRTWPMRGTLHLVPAADVRWMLALLTPRVLAAGAGRARRLGLDDATLARARRAVVAALQGNEPLTREAVFASLERSAIATTDQRGYHLLSRLAMEGLICFGPRSGKQPTFVLLDEWVPATRSVEHEAALAELTRRYLVGHGPVTLHDLARWAGLTIADARLGLASLGSEVSRETIDGTDYWLAAGASEASGSAHSAYLLPGFDEYLLGYQDRRAMLATEDATRVVPGGNGIFLPTCVVDGRVVGTWRRDLPRNRVVVTVTPFSSQSSAVERSIADAAASYGEFLGRTATVT